VGTPYRTLALLRAEVGSPFPCSHPRVPYVVFMRVLFALLLLCSPVLAQSRQDGGVDPAVLGSELSRLGGAAFDRGYLTVVTRLDAVVDLSEALVKYADSPALRKLGQQQMQAAKASATIAQAALKRLGGPDLTLANKAHRSFSSFTGGLLGKSDATKSDADLYDRLVSARGQVLAGGAVALTRLSDPIALVAARDLLKREADGYTALRIAAPK